MMKIIHRKLTKDIGQKKQNTISVILFGPARK